MKNKLEFVISTEWQKFTRENSWVSFVPESAKDSSGAEYLRKKGSKIAYRKTKNGYKCANCSSEIVAKRVAHSIWNGPFPMSGLKECYYEEVPYCPKCEKKPSFSGSPIQ